MENASTTPSSLDTPIPMVKLRYEEKVAKHRYRQVATMTLSLQSRRTFRFLRKEFHLVNIALALLKCAEDDKYKSRKLATESALKNAEEKAYEWSVRFTSSLAKIKYDPPVLQRVNISFTVLSPRAGRVVQLIALIDTLCEQMLILEFHKQITFNDRNLVTQQLMEQLMLIKTAVTGKAELNSPHELNEEAPQSIAA